MLKKLSFFSIVLILSLVSLYFILAFTEPTQAPPQGNVSAPINVGSEAQTIAGDLTIGGELTVEGDSRVGPINDADDETPSYGNTLYFSGGGDWQAYDSENSDPLWISRYNIAENESELRVNIGDDPEAVDKFVVGMTYYGDSQWKPKFTVKMDGSICLGDTDCISSWSSAGDDLGDHTATQNVKLNGNWLSSDGGNEGLYVNSSGDVGIGNSSPSGLLHVGAGVGSLHYDAQGILLKSSTGARSLFEIHSPDGNSRLVLQVLDSPGNSYIANIDGNNLLLQTSGGDVGINTGSPQDKLHVSGGDIRIDSGYELYFSDNGQIRSYDNKHRILFRRSEDKLELREYGDIIFSPGSTVGTETAKMVVKSDGSVGIGTTAPTQKLDVDGYIKGRTGLCIGDTCLSSWPKLQCPVKRVIVDEDSSGWDEWAQYTSCTAYQDYVLLSSPQVCDNGNCSRVDDNNDWGCNPFCQEFGFSSGVWTDTGTGTYIYQKIGSDQWDEGYFASGGGAATVCKCSP